ncbi:hypothetical protein GCM10017161_22920 [Thalassotalea marina]|uniref:Uncharacterized protein n=1 Tax=Thalassotalea marina TaxID=1673741 RepID=A0A919BKR8_9GAMM|nr:hypothetical protein GCM10017161_22920 [Thalassotalea marina]
MGHRESSLFEVITLAIVYVITKDMSIEVRDRICGLDEEI